MAKQLVLNSLNIYETNRTGVHIGQESEKVNGVFLLKQDTYPKAVTFTGSKIAGFLRGHRISPSD
jgi:hypothetical protein